MKAMKTFLFFAALIFAATVPPAKAATKPDSFTYDKPHTQIMFSVSHLGFSHSHGRFTDFDGGFTFDAAHPDQGSASVDIKTKSLKMDDATWEEHLTGENFFNVAKFPDMTFKSTKVEMTGKDTAKMTGDLTLLGVTKPVTLDVTLNKEGVHPYTQTYIAGFSATGTIKRSDFGMNYGLPAVGDDVTIMIEVEGKRTEPLQTR
jgi:polyisoprenoid-binding protein YceI